MEIKVQPISETVSDSVNTPFSMDAFNAQLDTALLYSSLPLSNSISAEHTHTIALPKTQRNIDYLVQRLREANGKPLTARAAIVRDILEKDINLLNIICPTEASRILHNSGEYTSYKDLVTPHDLTEEMPQSIPLEQDVDFEFVPEESSARLFDEMKTLSDKIRSKMAEEKEIEMTEKVFKVSSIRSHLSELFHILKEIKTEQNAPHAEKDDLKYDFLNQKTSNANLDSIFEQIKQLSQFFKYDIFALDKTKMPFSHTDLLSLKEALYSLKNAVRDVFNQGHYPEIKSMIDDDTFSKLRSLFLFLFNEDIDPESSSASQKAESLLDIIEHQSKILLSFSDELEQSIFDLKGLPYFFWATPDSLFKGPLPSTLKPEIFPLEKINTALEQLIDKWEQEEQDYNKEEQNSDDESDETSSTDTEDSICKTMETSSQEEDSTSSLQKDDSSSKAEDLDMQKRIITKSIHYFNEEEPFLSSPKMGVFFKDSRDAPKTPSEKDTDLPINTENGKTTISGIFAKDQCNAVIIRYAFAKQLEYIFLCYLFGLDNGKNNISLVLPEMYLNHSPLELMRDKITWDEILVLLTSRFKFCITTNPRIFNKIKKFIIEASHQKKASHQEEANHQEKDKSGKFTNDLAALNWLIAKAFTQKKLVWKIDPNARSHEPSFDECESSSDECEPSFSV